MAFKNETGHAKNVANFEKMNAYVTGYGPAYQPSKTALQVSELQRLYAEARAILLTVQQLQSNKKLAQNARTVAFEQMRPLCTRIINMLRSSDASDKTIEDATAIINKIKGIRLTKKDEPAKVTETTPQMAEAEVTLYVPATDTVITPLNENNNGSSPVKRTHSSAQTSQDQLMEHFSRLLILLQSEIHYNPNEVELQLGTLQMYLETLRMANSAFIQADVELSNARIIRDNLLYKGKNNICDVAQDVKQYVKALFGVKSSQYKQIRGLRFVRN